MTTRSVRNGFNNMDKFVNELHALLKINMEAQKQFSYDGMMTRLKAVINVAKKINDGFENVFHEFVASSIQQTGKLMSTMYLKMYEMLTESRNAHLKEYIVGENEILNVKKMALKIINPCRKAMNILFKLIEKFAETKMSYQFCVINYQKIRKNHFQLENNYCLRKRTAVYYEEEDQVDDLSDSDYKPYEYGSVNNNNMLEKKFNRVVLEDHDDNDSDSDYNPEDDADDVDDEFHFDDDDYAEEDDYDYEDDSLDEEDAQFVSDYYNDPDYEYIKKVKKTSDNDDDYDEEDDADDVDDEFHFDDDDYAEETEEDDDDYEDEESQNIEDKQFLDDYYNDPDYEEDKKFKKSSDDDSEYDPADDADAESVDDEFHFDDDDYAEETEEDDDDYEDEDSTESVEDALFVSDYYNDPDYEEEQDDCNVVNNDIQLEGGINYDEDSESVEKIDLSEYEKNIVYNYKNNKLENIEFKMYEKGM